MTALRCCNATDAARVCEVSATMIDDKGFLYCGPCGRWRRDGGARRCRTLTRGEMRTLETGGTISYRPRPVVRCPVARADEYERAAQWCADHLYSGAAGDPLPELVGSDVNADINADIPAFMERVRAYRYAAEMGRIEAKYGRSE